MKEITAINPIITLIVAFIGGLVLLLVEVLGDKFEIEDNNKCWIQIISFLSIVLSIIIIRTVGAILLGKIIIFITIYLALWFLPTILYKNKNI